RERCRRQLEPSLLPHLSETQRRHPGTGRIVCLNPHVVFGSCPANCRRSLWSNRGIELFRGASAAFPVSESVSGQPSCQQRAAGGSCSFTGRILDPQLCGELGVERFI